MNEQEKTTMSDKERIEDLEATLNAIRQWCDAYPTSVFPPISNEDMKRAEQLLKLSGISMAAMHGQWGRHIMLGISDMIRLVLP